MGEKEAAEAQGGHLERREWALPPPALPSRLEAQVINAPPTAPPPPDPITHGSRALNNLDVGPPASLNISAKFTFDKAVADSKKLTSKPSNEELLDLYALFKIANGEDIASAPAPGMFDLKGKAKKNAWQKKVDEGVTADQAKEQYVALVEKLKTQYGYDENKQPEAVGN
ncbi:hypothetical protein N8I77_000898 [Diaporthe amygdali]|uniref:ACB domain-containing protein n=1 Tax=Phomopsis amygdali TaxID=1214568 RepID=A0AAD9SQG5_PHOAM|nr:hypothetical protein N8I77_000898 [Diaporthe amygdali]